MKFRFFSLVFFTAFLCFSARAQFDLEESHTAASLRGIDSLGAGVGWASGSNGTVLRTEDGGYLWQPCTVPKGAEKLDFRGVQGFDANTAFVMSSGKGDLSRIYKTNDGCQSWTLVFTNPDPEGFWDALQFLHDDPKRGYLLGDPVAGSFVVYVTVDGGSHWVAAASKDLAEAAPGIGAFAASNSSLLISPGAGFSFATGGPGGPFVYTAEVTCTALTAAHDPLVCLREDLRLEHVKLPLSGATASEGIFSLASKVAVGGGFSKPEQAAGTAAYFDAFFGGWFAAKHPPHGYRSAVAYDKASDAWLAVGPNGADVSFDDGKNWQPLKGNTATDWNAISLPFVVGAKGRIGKVRDGVLKK